MKIAVKTIILGISLVASTASFAAENRAPRACKMINSKAAGKASTIDFASAGNAAAVQNGTGTAPSKDDQQIRIRKTGESSGSVNE